MNEWYDHYRDRLRSCPVLDDTWFPEALARGGAGDLDARNRIAAASLQVVLDVAREFEGCSAIPLHALVEDGNTAVLGALDTFGGNDCETFKIYLERNVRRVLAALTGDE